MALDWGGSVPHRVLAGGMLACRVRARAPKYGRRAVKLTAEGPETLARVVVARQSLGVDDFRV